MSTSSQDSQSSSLDQLLAKINSSNNDLNKKHTENLMRKLDHLKDTEAELDLALENLKIKDQLIAHMDNLLAQHIKQIQEMSAKLTSSSSGLRRDNVDQSPKIEVL